MQLNLKNLRKARSLTQAQLAKLCDDWLVAKGKKVGRTDRKIQKMESLPDYLEINLIDALCNALNCNVDDLIKVERV